MSVWKADQSLFKASPVALHRSGDQIVMSCREGDVHFSDLCWADREDVVVAVRLCCMPLILSISLLIVPSFFLPLGKVVI